MGQDRWARFADAGRLVRGRPEGWVPFALPPQNQNPDFLIESTHVASVTALCCVGAGEEEEEEFPVLLPSQLNL